MLIGGGSGGHITPLLAVAHSIKQTDSNIVLAAVCEKGGKYKKLFEDCPDIDELYEIPAGKLRRYGNQSLMQQLKDFETLSLNLRDVPKTIRGLSQAYRLLKRYKPDAILIKGGFVGVPVGLAAAKLKIPYITHDSDSTPGLANRIIGKWASVHATGMPANLYSYPKQKTVYTGIPVSDKITEVDSSDQKQFKKDIGMAGANRVITLTGGSQGGKQLNDDFASISNKLLEEYPDLGLVVIAGASNEAEVNDVYDKLLSSSERTRVLVKGFVSDLYKYTGAADIVISRASATSIAEIAAQAKTLLLVPGKLADDHQRKNSEYLVKRGAAVMVPDGDADGLYLTIKNLLDNQEKADGLSVSIKSLAVSDASDRLAKVTIKTAAENEIKRQ